MWRAVKKSMAFFSFIGTFPSHLLSEIREKRAHAFPFNLSDQTTWWILIFHFFSTHKFKCVTSHATCQDTIHFHFVSHIFESWQCFPNDFPLLSRVIEHAAFTIESNRNIKVEGKEIQNEKKYVVSGEIMQIHFGMVRAHSVEVTSIFTLKW